MITWKVYALMFIAIIAVFVAVVVNENENNRDAIEGYNEKRVYGTREPPITQKPEKFNSENIQEDSIDTTYITKTIMNTSTEWHTFTDEEYNFSFSYPPGFGIQLNYEIPDYESYASKKYTILIPYNHPSEGSRLTDQGLSVALIDLQLEDLERIFISQDPVPDFRFPFFHDKKEVIINGRRGISGTFGTPIEISKKFIFLPISEEKNLFLEYMLLPQTDEALIWSVLNTLKIVEPEITNLRKYTNDTYDIAFTHPRIWGNIRESQEINKIDEGKRLLIEFSNAPVVLSFFSDNFIEGVGEGTPFWFTNDIFTATSVPQIKANLEKFGIPVDEIRTERIRDFRIFRIEGERGYVLYYPAITYFLPKNIPSQVVPNAIIFFPDISYENDIKELISSL